MCESSLFWVNCSSLSGAWCESGVVQPGKAVNMTATTRMLNRHWAYISLQQGGKLTEQFCRLKFCEGDFDFKEIMFRYTHSSLRCFGCCWDSCWCPSFSFWIKIVVTCWGSVWGGRNVCSRVNNVNLAGEEGRCFSSLEEESWIALWRLLLNLCPGRTCQCFFSCRAAGCSELRG